MNTRGRIWKLGDDIDTDSLAPGRYMSAPIEILAAHCLESVRPEFAGKAKAGDIVVAGRNFGVGSSREQAVEALKHLGISAVLAISFAGIFYRNAINLGLPALECGNTEAMTDGEIAELDIETGQLLAGRSKVECAPLPDFLRVIVDDGGLVPHLERRFQREDIR